MSDAYTLARKQDLNYAAQKQKELFAKKTDIPDDYIVSGSQTQASSADGGSNVFTFTKKGGGTATFTVKNGSKGSTGEPEGRQGQMGPAQHGIPGRRLQAHLLQQSRQRYLAQKQGICI